jgi:hypothetical protein
VWRVKPKADFGKNKEERDGLDSSCRACLKKYHFVRKYGIDVLDRKKEDEQRGLKRCRICYVTKPLDDFYKMKAGRLGVRAICKVCITTGARSFYAQCFDAKHKDRANLLLRKYRITL